LLEDAVSRRDPQRIHVSAHRLKSATRNFFAPAVQKALSELEILGRKNELDRLPTISAQARGELDRLEEALRGFLATLREPSIPRAHFPRIADRGEALRQPDHD
jgi:HPt (histidine-containing phosphotransfer) domain-containing protein